MSILLALLLSVAQDKGKAAHPKVDQAKVDEAIQKGNKYLIGGASAFGTFVHGKRHQGDAVHAYGELILLTLLHSGYYTGEEPALQPIVSFCLEREITSTYTASLGAMAFQKLDARKYQARIAQYAQFLCDNQCENGQWDYGAPLPPEPPDPKKTPTGGAGSKPREDVASAGGTGEAAKSAAPKKAVGRTDALPRIPIRKRKPGPPNGDNSNSQYAALGLRACLDAGIDVDPKVLVLARKWWQTSQNTDGGWGYNGNGEQGGADNPTSVSNTSYGSMTVGAVGAMCIFDYFLGGAYKNDPVVLKGLDWLAKNYDVQKNPKKTSFATLYYLYGLERVGMLYGSEKIGNYEWYPDGAEHLLRIQQAGGAWSAGDSLPREPQVDTCFAILFLRRGTPPLKPVATGGVPKEPAGAPVANNEAAAARGGLAGARGPVDVVAPGWRLSGYLKPGPRNPLIGDARGRSNILTTYPIDLTTAPTLKRTVEVAVGQKTRLKITVGHHETGQWTLLVKADGKELLKKPVAPQTTKDGWLELEVDLASFGGSAPLVEVQAVPGGKGVDVSYWAEVLILDR